MPEQNATRDERPGGGRIVLSITRVWVPVGIALVGIVGIVIGGGRDDVIAGAGVSLVIVALIVWMVNWMYRMSVESNREREDEERAREYFDAHGRWPDE
jgi:ABC-type transport system involved in cytochrome bd biosynthesis fused ATPase/permease subunit